MIRKIKFRAWNSDKKQMVKNPHDLLIPIDDGQVIFERGRNNTFGGDMGGRYELMQFTGLHDKKGKEIYEGDIIEVWDMNRGCVGCSDEENEDKHDSPDCENYICTQKVEWSGYGGYYCDEDTGDGCMTLGNDFFEFEIIGNIYENPELLTK